MNDELLQAVKQQKHEDVVKFISCLNKLATFIRESRSTATEAAELIDLTAIEIQAQSRGER